MSLIQPGRFVVMLQGRHAGKKALVLAAYPEATGDRKFPYAVVMGIEAYPKKVTKEMTQEQLVKKTQVKLFVKAVNFNHIMLTRHTLKEDDLFKKISVEKVVASLKVERPALMWAPGMATTHALFEFASLLKLIIFYIFIFQC